MKFLKIFEEFISEAWTIRDLGKNVLSLLKDRKANILDKKEFKERDKTIVFRIQAIREKYKILFRFPLAGAKIDNLKCIVIDLNSGKEDHGLTNKESWELFELLENYEKYLNKPMYIPKHMYSMTTESAENKISTYLNIEVLPNGLKLILTDEGKERDIENDDLNEQNFKSYFEEIETNSEYKYIPNIGNEGFGITDAPGITFAYYYDDNSGLLSNDDTKDYSELYYYNDYQTKDFTSELKENGFVIFSKHQKY